MCHIAPGMSLCVVTASWLVVPGECCGSTCDLHLAVCKPVQVSVHYNAAQHLKVFFIEMLHSTSRSA
jgi:hypothetical protein